MLWHLGQGHNVASSLTPDKLRRGTRNSCGVHVRTLYGCLHIYVRNVLGCEKEVPLLYTHLESLLQHLNGKAFWENSANISDVRRIGTFGFQRFFNMIHDMIRLQVSLAHARERKRIFSVESPSLTNITCEQKTMYMLLCTQMKEFPQTRLRRVCTRRDAALIPRRPNAWEMFRHKSTAHNPVSNSV